jgi:hypothetical protein
MAGLPQWVKQLAVRQLPPGMAERMAEEWQAHLDATPSVAQRTMVAAGFLIAAVRCELAAKIARSGESPLLIPHRVLAVVLLLLELPIFLIVPLLIKLESPGPVLVWSSGLGPNGKAVSLPTFRCPPATLVGWLLRKTKVRHFPLLYSAFRGQFALIRPTQGGPR